MAILSVGTIEDVFSGILILPLLGSLMCSDVARESLSAVRMSK